MWYKGLFEGPTGKSVPRALRWQKMALTKNIDYLVAMKQMLYIMLRILQSWL